MSRGSELLDPRIIQKFGDDYVGHSPGSDEYVFRCPYCEDNGKTPDLKGNMYVNNKTLLFFCHRCGARGHITEYVKGYNFDKNPTYNELSELLGDIIEPNDGVDFCYEIPKLRPLEDTDAYKYLIKRGFTKESIDFYDIRLGPVVSRYKNRIIIPNRVVYNEEGRCFTDMFVARYYRTIPKDPVTNKDLIPKYLNPFGDNRRKVVFNLQNIKSGSPIIISEGCITSIFAGVNSVATYGKYVTDYQLIQILEKNPSRIYVGLDPDAYTTALELCRRIRKVSAVPIYILKLPDGEDANSIGHKKFMEYVHKSEPYNELELKIKNILGLD